MKHLKAGAAALIAAGAAYGYYQNNALQVTRHTLNVGLSRPVKLVCLSDLHGKQFGRCNASLIDQVRALSPDVIVFPGDTVSADCHNLDLTVLLMRTLCSISPCFLIAGNHEHRSGRWDEIAQMFRLAGVCVLENEQFDGEVQGIALHILGLDEGLAASRFDYLRAACKTLQYADNRPALQALSKQSGVRIVLSHFPENYALINQLSYCRFPFDLMVCGHAHGGHFRFGSNISFFAAGQGFLPRFSEGIYGHEPTLLVSRGLGNDSPLPRIHNRPEIVLVTMT